MHVTGKHHVPARYRLLNYMANIFNIGKDQQQKYACLQSEVAPGPAFASSQSLLHL